MVLAGVEHILSRRLPLYEKAAELGDNGACWPLLERLLFRAGENADVVKARKHGDLARGR